MKIVIAKPERFLNGGKFECPRCNRECGLDEMDLKEDEKILCCPNCGAVIIENYREKESNK